MLAQARVLLLGTTAPEPEARSLKAQKLINDKRETPYKLPTLGF